MTDPAINNLKLKINKWRRQKPSRSTPMPEDLWHTAVQLCVRHKVGMVCRETGIDQGKLNLRMGKKCRTKKRRREKPSFVELTMPKMESNFDAQSCEFVRADGARLRVKVESSKLHSLVSSFFGGQP